MNTIILIIMGLVLLPFIIQWLMIITGLFIWVVTIIWAIFMIIIDWFKGLFIK